MSTPALQLETLFILDGDGRILSTREPQGTPGPLFFLVRSATECAWAVRTDVDAELAEELLSLARKEPPVQDVRVARLHADRYCSLLSGRVQSGPAFGFPPSLINPPSVVEIEDEALLEMHFRGWVPGEIGAGRAPVWAVVEDGYPVSICFSARRSDLAAEAGVETAAEFRGMGSASRATAAWARAIRGSGRTPLYSTDWTNEASLALARKLALEPYASDWSVSD
ncbi:MAG: GNAT family N-acetyltransferase [Gemmatimonadaceae bacterium]